MEARYLPDGTIAVTGTRRTQRFSRLVIGVGWPDQEEGRLCVVGTRLDGLHHCLWEYGGGLWALGDEARDAGKRFLAESIVVDASDTISTSHFRTLEWEDQPRAPGLQAWRRSGSTLSAPVFQRPCIVPVPPQVSAGFRSTLEMVKGMMDNKKVLIHTSNCPTLTHTIRRNVSDLLKSPTMKAFTWALWLLERQSMAQPDWDREAEAWYDNAPRLS
jgi:hypothetical protein